MRFGEFLAEMASRREAVNLVFEERLFNLVGILEKITGPLAAAHIPYEVVGGLAVLVHVEATDPAHSILTRDVDLMIQRSDLERVIAVAESRFRRGPGFAEGERGGADPSQPE